MERERIFPKRQRTETVVFFNSCSLVNSDNSIKASSKGISEDMSARDNSEFLFQNKVQSIEDEL